MGVVDFCPVESVHTACCCNAVPFVCAFVVSACFVCRSPFVETEPDHGAQNACAPSQLASSAALAELFRLVLFKQSKEVLGDSEVTDSRVNE